MAHDLKLMADFREAKTRLQAYADDGGFEKPVYETVSKRIENFRKIYKVRVIIEGLVDTTGEGYSRRLAEYRAAINAMNEIKEVREEQKKSKEEQLLAKEKTNGVNNSELQNDKEVSNDSTGGSPSPKEGSSPKLNGDHNSDDINDNDVDHHQNNSIIISADINTSASEEQEVEEVNQKLVNGHNGDDQSEGSSSGSAENGVNGSNEKEVNPEENGVNSNNTFKMNDKRSEFLNGMSPSRTFQPLKKTPVQLLHDFCMERQSPYPFYDTTYKDRTFLIRCRIEFNENQEKREFFGTGTGNTSKEAKLMAADDIIQQLSALSLLV